MFPNLQNESILALDIETYDPDLKTLGPGPRRDSHITCLSIAAQNKVWSWNLTHEGPKVENFEGFYRWLEDSLSEKEVIAANCTYDFDFLQYKINIKKIKAIRDVQTSEFLINEHKQAYSLDSLAEKYLGRCKEKEGTQAYAEERGWKGDHRAHLYKMPFEIVKPYVEADASLTLQVYAKQIPELEKQELNRVFDIECRLIPMLLHMRKVGVPIDWAGVDRVRGLMLEQGKKAQADLRLILEDNGFNPDHFNANSAAQLAELFDRLGVEYGMTAPGKTTKNVEGFKPKPSFTKDFLDEIAHPIGQILLESRAAGKVDGTFLHQLEVHRVGDRVYPIFHPTRAGEYGTIYGRLSCTMPSLQTIPGDKQPEKKKLVRGLFIPEPGCWIAAPDYSQADYRFFAHFAQGPGAKQIQDYFQDPDADMHQFTATMAGIERKNAKAPNFGIMFGMGSGGLARNTGKTVEEASALLSLIKEKVPALRDTPRVMTRVWEQRGYVKTILGRRAHLVNRDKAYRAIAMIIGGSTADLMKKAMVDTYEAGVYDVLTPHISLHDELMVSVPTTKQGVKALREMREIMRKVFDLRVPLKVSAEASPISWADVSEDGFSELEKIVE